MRLFMKQLISSVLISAMAVSLAACSDSGSSAIQDLDPPVFDDVTVHDPSVMYDDGTFYIIGSHLQAAKSTDLVSWEQISTEVSNQNPLIPNVFIELAETFAWAQTRTLWAGDWIYLEETGKYHMYYCACEGSSPLSALGMATADAPEGPYTNDQILLKSGMWGEISPDGIIFDANIHPNTIDPHTFFDADGQLWMIYGSYSGGIFILKMDEKTGLPIEGQGYGKHLLGGRHGQIEAAYVLYNPEFKYYYLFLSYGGLDSNGGYQIRVSRSLSADGPYEDISGQDMSQAAGDLNYFKRYGQKLFGNHEWGFEGTRSMGSGYVSPGHNSAYLDEESGRSFLIFHTRFPRSGELHQVRVHELFFTEDGWPIVAPFRYTGEALNPMAEVKKNDIVGSYLYINHDKEVGSAITKSIEIELTNDGLISGSVSGSWSLSENNVAELVISGQRYRGLFLWQWIEADQRYGLTFTAVSDLGMSVWATKQD